MSLLERDILSTEELKGPIVYAGETTHQAAEKGQVATDKYVTLSSIAR
jgi:hypothetical protein